MECKKIGLSKKLFQTSFYEHIIRNQSDYEETVKYIYENPIRWYNDELYTEEHWNTKKELGYPGSFLFIA